MELQKCRMVSLSVFEQRGSILPIAEVIVIALSKEEAKKYAEQELKPHIPDQSALALKDRYALISRSLGPILFSPFPTTVFLYTQSAGRIK